MKADVICVLKLLVLLVAAAAAFRPPLLSEELGCSPTLSMILRRPDGFFFDPLRLATDDNFARLRESELKHGRICMAANLGIVIPPILQRMLEEQVIPSASKATKASSGAVNAHHLPSASILKNLSWVTPTQSIQILLTCAFLEAFIFFQRDPKDMPGDYGTGYFGLRDKGVNERALVAELENGRLAMLAVAGHVTAELVSGQTWLEQWKFILYAVVERLVLMNEGVNQIASAVN